MPPRLAVVLNCASRSRSAAGHRGSLAALLREGGFDAELFVAERPADLPALAHRAAEGSADVVVAAGGDGTVSAVAAAAVAASKPLGVLPLGTVNHFARLVGAPLDLPGAVAALASPARRRLDVALANDRVFVNNSTLGFYPGAVRRRDRLRAEHGVPRAPAVAWALTVGLAAAPPSRLTLVIDGAPRAVETRFVFVGSHDHRLGALELAGGAPVPPGSLGVCIAQPRGAVDAARLLARAAAGRLAGGPGFEVLRATELRVEADAPAMDVTLDGEVVTLDLPLRYRALRDALTVVAPARGSTRSS